RGGAAHLPLARVPRARSTAPALPGSDALGARGVAASVGRTALAARWPRATGPGRRRVAVASAAAPMAAVTAVGSAGAAPSSLVEASPIRPGVLLWTRLRPA